MMRRAFTMLEMMLAVFILGLITAFSVLTFNAVSRSWQVSTDYLDKLQRTDFALSQVTAALRSMYYPHDGKQDDRYGFVLHDNGDGRDPDSSDVIEWSKTGRTIVGNRSSVADTVHRVQIMVLEEGDDRKWTRPIRQTGLYARLCPDSALRPDDADIDFSFANEEMYAPVLISSGICGFNCRVVPQKDEGDSDTENDKSSFKDAFDNSNAVPYKVELSFTMIDPDGRAYRSGAAPIVRIVRIPVHEQSLDGAEAPGGEKGSSTDDRNRGGAR